MSRQNAERFLLVILSVFLAAVVYVQFVLLPLIRECTRLEGEVGEAELSLALLQSDIRSSEGYTRENDELRAAVSGISAALLPAMGAEQLDIMITRYFEECGLSPKALEIEETGRDGVLTEISAEYNAEGSYSALLKFIERLSAEYAVEIRGIEMKAIIPENVRSASADRLSFTIRLSAYMLSEAEE